MDEKGYIRFDCEFNQSAKLPERDIAELNSAREQLYELGLVGVTSSGVGYGNVSVRSGANAEFVISGTQTGHLAELNGAHYSKVTSFDIAANALTCEGPVAASSESLTHAAVYQARDDINSVLHVHSLELWKRLRASIPTTAEAAEAGTPAMAHEITRVLAEQPTDSAYLIVMGGHHAGLLSCGTSIEGAMQKLLDGFCCAK